MANDNERQNGRVQYSEEELQEMAATFDRRFGQTAEITASQLLDGRGFQRETPPTEGVSKGAESTDERAEDRVRVLSRGRELMEQEQFENTNPTTAWTMQQFSTNPVGEPWFALQQQNEDGAFRTLTGTREELDKVVHDHHLTVMELPPITEGEYFRRAVGEVGLEPEITREEESLGVAV
jgi:hypothetical protein